MQLTKPLSSLSTLGKTFLRYFAAIILSVCAILIKFYLDPFLTTDIPFLFSFTAIIFTTWFAGHGPGILALFITTIFTGWLFIYPLYTFNDLIKILIMGVFALEGIFIIGILYTHQMAEKKIAKERDRVKKYLDIAGSFILLLDYHGKVTFINQTGARVLGYKTKEIQGKNWIPDFIPQGEQIQVKKLFERVITADKGVTQFFETYVRTKSGEKRLIAWHTTAVFGDDKRIEGTLSSGEDITERRLAEVDRIILLTQAEKDRRAAEEAKREAAQLYTSEKKARLNAQEAVRARDEFLSIASHELKTPLTSMLLQLQSVLRNTQQQTLENFSIKNMVALLQSAENQSKRLAKLINDLLNVSLINANRLQLEFERCNLSTLVREVVKNYGKQIEVAKTKVTVNTAANVVGMWDKLRLEQVVTNLLTNALKYGNEKPIVITVKKIDSQAYLSIIDQGIGIDQKDLKKVLTPFQRAVTGKEYKGLGVGLYIVQQIVTAHGGKLTIDSVVGKGTTFTITLPLKVPTQPSSH